MKCVLIATLLTVVSVVTACDDVSSGKYLRKYGEEVTRAGRDGSDFRLDGSVEPSHYDVELLVRMQEETFQGKVDIRLVVKVANLNKIVLHAGTNITIEKWMVALVTNPTIPLPKDGDLQYDSTTQKLTLPLINPLGLGVAYILSIEYEGKFGKDLKGFHKGSYDENGDKKWTASTQLSQVECRRVFPSFDEPRFRATFKLTVHHESAYRVHTNSKSIRTDPSERDPSLTREVFDTTPSIPTYIFGILISQFQNRASQASPMEIRSRPEAFNQTSYALTIGEQILAQLDVITQIYYYTFPKTEKMDMVAVPDFFYSAMENYALILYKENALLFDSIASSAQNKQRIATVIGHELAHHWFGNLVAIEWWSYTWLKEGFARYYETFATSKVDPSLKLEEQFSVLVVQAAMQFDATEETHPMSNMEAFTPSEISKMFGRISYEKGASILNWIKHLMGEDRFTAAIRDYLRTNSWKVANPENFFQSLATQDPERILRPIIEPWTTQAGYPVILIELEGDNLRLSQKRFTLYGESDNTRWSIPLNWATRREDFFNTSTLTVFQRTHDDGFAISVPNGPYYVLNVQQIGFYRINYNYENWIAIKNALNSSSFGGIHVLNRAQIVDDLLNLARANYLKYGLVMEILEYLVNENEWAPWLAAFNGFEFLSQRIISGDLAYKNHLEKYMQELLTNIYNSIGFIDNPPTDHLSLLLRINVLKWACKFNSDCIQKAREEFSSFRRDPSYRLDPQIRPAVYCTGIREGNSVDWNYVWERYLDENVASERAVLLTGLGCTKNSDLLNRYLDNILTDSIRQHDKSAAFANVYSGNLENVQIAFDYILGNVQKWREVMDIASTINSLAERFTSRNQIDQLNTFISQQQTSGNLAQDVIDKLKKSAKLAEINIEWDELRVPELYRYFRGEVDGGDSSNVVRLSIALMVVMGAVLRFLS